MLLKPMVNSFDYNISVRGSTSFIYFKIKYKDFINYKF